MPRLPARRNSGGMQRNQVGNFLNEMLAPQQMQPAQHPSSTRNTSAAHPASHFSEPIHYPEPVGHNIPLQPYAGAAAMHAGAANQPMAAQFNDPIFVPADDDDDPVISAALGVGMPVMGSFSQVNMPSEPLAPAPFA